MITKHSKRKIYSFIVMLFFSISFIICIFYNAANEKIFDPAIETSLNLFALSDSVQTPRLLIIGEENVPAEKLYCQINSVFEGKNCVYDGIITIQYQFNAVLGSYSENLKDMYLKCDAGKTLFADGFILNVPKENGEMLLSIEGVGLINNQEVHFIQTASVYASEGAVKINEMPEDIAFPPDSKANALFGLNLKILSFLIFLASAGNYVWCLIEEKKGNPNLYYRLNAVPIEKPINLLKVNLIRLDKAKNLIDIAKKRNKEILVYVFSAKLAYYYVITNDVTYLYVHNLNPDLPKSNGRALKKDVLRTSQNHK